MQTVTISAPSRIKQIVEVANERGVGQFHVFERSDFIGVLCLHSTWHSYQLAITVAKRQNGAVFNSLARCVASFL